MQSLNAIDNEVKGYAEFFSELAPDDIVMGQELMQRRI
jgi:hypothetical protein